MYFPVSLCGNHALRRTRTLLVFSFSHHVALYCVVLFCLSCLCSSRLCLVRRSGYWLWLATTCHFDSLDFLLHSVWCAGLVLCIWLDDRSKWGLTRRCTEVQHDARGAHSKSLWAIEGVVWIYSMMLWEHDLKWTDKDLLLSGR